MPPIIKVTDLSKSYILNHEGKERYTALRDVMTNKAKKLFSFPKSLTSTLTSTSTHEEFWALKDINFEIEQGDRVGIIGRNGAGKSTLLKILSRITEPTKGRIELNGRVASLLEVGTGFHPELTGRENIFLNGAILGMSRAEIKRKFDEIVDFAEVERFLDTPVKRYSSGMYVRLAFAVAAHLEPEILIVDEVLAVGDAQFQKKCLGKMEDVSKNEGRTVLFVSHNMGVINSLCNNAMLLKGGSVVYSGHKSDVINYYSNSSIHETPSLINAFKQYFEIKRIYLSQRGLETNHLVNKERITFTLEFMSSNINDTKFSFELSIKNNLGFRIIFTSLGLCSGNTFTIEKGLQRISFDLELPVLAEGTYFIDLILAEPGIRRIETIEDIISFDIIEAYIPISGWTFKGNEENILIFPSKFMFENNTPVG